MGSLLADDSPPRVDTTITHRALGTLKILGGDIHEAWVQISHPKYDPSEINCTLQTKAPWGSPLLPMGSVMDWTIEAESPVPHFLRFWLGKQSYSGTLARLELDAYEILSSPNEITNGDQLRVIIELNRRGVLRPKEDLIRRFDSSIEESDGEAHSSLKWETQGVENEMFVRHTYERTLVSRDEGHLQIERPCITQRRLASSSTSISEVLDAIQVEISDYLLILSFVSREPIEWYQIDVERDRKYNEDGFYKGRLRRVVTERLTRRQQLPLVEYRALTTGLFQRMAATLQDSNSKDALRMAISFDVASWVQHGLEDSFVSCQAALEAMIGILEEENPILPKKEVPWTEFDKAINACLKQLANDGVLSIPTLSLMEKKVGEFRRAPIADLILYHANRLNVRTEDLWPNTVSFEDGLRLALRQRNFLVHAAHIEDPSEVNYNLIRMRTLVERFILAYLKVRQDEVSWLHDQLVRRVNRQ